MFTKIFEEQKRTAKIIFKVSQLNWHICDPISILQQCWINPFFMISHAFVALWEVICKKDQVYYIQYEVKSSFLQITSRFNDTIFDKMARVLKALHFLHSEVICKMDEFTAYCM